MNSNLPKPAVDYLRHLRQALSVLPDAERQDVLAELESHLAARHERGDADLLAGFPAPDEYAAELVSARALNVALARGSSFELGRSLLGGRLGTLASHVCVAPLLGAQLVGFVFLVLAALKPFFPASIGLFTRGNAFSALGAVSVEPGMVEVLGWWTIPLFLAVSVVLLWGSTRALRALARRRLRQGAARAAALR